LRAGGWIAANSAGALPAAGGAETATIDADAIALGLGNPQAVNLIVLGRAVSTGRLFCTLEDVTRTIRRKLHEKPALLEGALAALTAGITNCPRS
jgi:indolepyruvate ferredoxin oxidoreductase beta subunit